MYVYIQISSAAVQSGKAKDCMKEERKGQSSDFSNSINEVAVHAATCACAIYLATYMHASS